MSALRDIEITDMETVHEKINYDCFEVDCAMVGEMRLPILKDLFMEFVLRLYNLQEWCSNEGERRCIAKFVDTVTKLQYFKNEDGSKKFRHLLHEYDMQKYKVINLINNNTVLGQHYGIKKGYGERCDIYKIDVCKFCRKHVPKTVISENEKFLFPLKLVIPDNCKIGEICSDNEDDSASGSASSIEFPSGFPSGLSDIEVPIRGLVDRHAAIGNFANFDEYEQYVALMVNERYAEAALFAAGLAAGAHPHTLRDPFPFGHCKLLLFKSDSYRDVFRAGLDVLTRDDLVQYRDQLDLDKVICLSINPAINQAHLSLHYTPQAGMSVLVTVRQLVGFLDNAFSHGVCDYEELVRIYYNIRPDRR